MSAVLGGGVGGGVAERVREADNYLAARTGSYEKRCERYDAALEVLHDAGLDDDSTVFDVGSGWGEFGVRMHMGKRCDCAGCTDMLPMCGGRGFDKSRARYVPVDAALTGIDLDQWYPPRTAEYFVCLEVLEHLRWPDLLALKMRKHATRAVVVSTPNPDTTDVLGMDDTHRTPINRAMLESWGFAVEERSFYGQPADSLFGVWSHA